MRILLASSICPVATERLRRDHDLRFALDASLEELRAAISDREVLVFRSGVSISAEVMACAPRLGLLVRAGAGLDNVDLQFVRDHSLRLVNIPEPGGKAVAEMAFALMLALARQLLPADRSLRQGHWAKHELKGALLSGRTLGIVGTGKIGTRVGALGAALGMRVLGCVEHPSEAVRDRLLQSGIELRELREVMQSADFVSLHVPLQDSTRHLINATTLAFTKPGAFLINLARGGVVDESALYTALTTSGQLAGAALDVHEQEGPGKISPLAQLPNVVLTPHIGAMTTDSQQEIGRRVVNIINQHAKESGEAKH